MRRTTPSQRHPNVRNVSRNRLSNVSHSPLKRLAKNAIGTTPIPPRRRPMTTAPNPQRLSVVRRPVIQSVRPNTYDDRYKPVPANLRVARTKPSGTRINSAIGTRKNDTTFSVGSTLEESHAAPKSNAPNTASNAAKIVMPSSTDPKDLIRSFNVAPGRHAGRAQLRTQGSASQYPRPRRGYRQMLSQI